MAGSFTVTVLPTGAAMPWSQERVTVPVRFAGGAGGVVYRKKSYPDIDGGIARAVRLTLAFPAPSDVSVMVRSLPSPGYTWIAWLAPVVVVQAGALLQRARTCQVPSDCTPSP